MGKYAVHRVDANAEAIYQALEAVGASVCRLGSPLDALVGFRGVNYLLEVKGPRGRLLPTQKRFLASWRGHARVVRNVDEAFVALGLAI